MQTYHGCHTFMQLYIDTPAPLQKKLQCIMIVMMNKKNILRFNWEDCVPFVGVEMSD